MRLIQKTCTGKQLLPCGGRIPLLLFAIHRMRNSPNHWNVYISDAMHCGSFILYLDIFFILTSWIFASCLHYFPLLRAARERERETGTNMFTDEEMYFIHIYGPNLQRLFPCKDVKTSITRVASCLEKDGINTCVFMVLLHIHGVKIHAKGYNTIGTCIETLYSGEMMVKETEELFYDTLHTAKMVYMHMMQRRKERKTLTSSESSSMFDTFVKTLQSITKTRGDSVRRAIEESTSSVIIK